MRIEDETSEFGASTIDNMHNRAALNLLQPSALFRSTYHTPCPLV